jgi:hypothetical protein
MNSPLISLANTCYVAAALVGLPSAMVVTFYAVVRIRLWLAPAGSADVLAGVQNPDAILLILGGFSRGLGALAGAVAKFGHFALGVLAALAAAGLVLALALFLTGRGLHAQEAWARGLGGVLAGGVFLLSLLAFLSLRGPLALVAATTSAASGYALVLLWRGFPA